MGVGWSHLICAVLYSQKGTKSALEAAAPCPAGYGSNPDLSSAVSQKGVEPRPEEGGRGTKMAGAGPSCFFSLCHLEVLKGGFNLSFLP